MKFMVIVYSVIFACISGVSGCKSENKELKNDATEIANVMCKSLEAMKNLKSADPADSIRIRKLQAEYKKVENELTILYGKFRKKYEAKSATREFTGQLRRYLNESMLECKSLSKEDRDNFEKGMK